ncbi:MAG: hypothetical protein ACFCGT_14775 [Sandaracinaceae bacterium]
MTRSLGFLAALLLTACGGGAVGDVVLRASGGMEASQGILASQTADGWVVEFDHAVIRVEDFSLRTANGDDANVAFDPLVVELVPETSLIDEIRAVPAQRWDRTSYLLSPVEAGDRVVGVEDRIVTLMRDEGWSSYYEGRLVAPTGTVDENGDPVTVIPFAFGFPVVASYAFCVNGLDRTDGVVVPVSSAVDVELTWHLTHLFFDSFVELSALRVEPQAARWDGATELTLPDLDVPLGGLRAIDGGPLIDDQGNPVFYIPGPSGADTLEEFVLAGRPGHFNGLEGFCMTEVTVLE